MVKPRFHERMGIPRQTLEKHHRQYLKGGLFDTPEIEGDFFHSVLREFGISKDPKNGWAKLAYELRLINMVMPDPIGEETKGKVELSHDCQRVANKLDDLARQAGELTHHTDVVVGLHALELNIADGVLHIMDTARILKALASHLNPRKHPAKWKSTERRRQRIDLACELSGLFESEFAQAAKPVGGSAPLELEDTNDWTRFFQAIASVFLNEQVTPDRQAILWEAASST